MRKRNFETDNKSDAAHFTCTFRLRPIHTRGFAPGACSRLRIGFTIEFLTNIEFFFFFFDMLLWLVCLDPAHVSVSLKDLALHKVKCQSGP